ncbi:MAG: hypothetical protein LBL46_04950 [Rickettsiales bacterium]|jgi:hypothetical protein|nr:hypothetical protein [Rickettsiales bacterium]
MVRVYKSMRRTDAMRETWPKLIPFLESEDAEGLADALTSGGRGGGKKIVFRLFGMIPLFQYKKSADGGGMFRILGLPIIQARRRGRKTTARLFALIPLWSVKRGW